MPLLKIHNLLRSCIRWVGVETMWKYWIGWTLTLKILKIHNFLRSVLWGRGFKNKERH